ncbi:hypothetical protein [Methylobacterium flocculans]|uniref:hypothetical protein n=1 Tax=Methylobacterium flocculans TaxID=2984843 RepID=UPI0021F2BF81|nr:hypothetical protein [Methylobacterium sp. FF17]
MMTTIGGFAITALPDGALVQLSDADPTMLPRFKQTFPRARFRLATRSWHVPGVLAVNRVTRFAEAVAQEQREVQARIERILRDAEFEGHAIPLDTPGLEGRSYLAALAHNGQKLSTRHILVSVRDDHVRVGFAYNEEAVALVRTVPGARFLPDLKAWSVSLANVRALHGVVDRMEESLARAAAAAARERGVDEEAREAAARARRAGRVLMLLALRPVSGSLVRIGAEARVIDGFGRTFLLDPKTASVWGPHLHGQEGRPCCYAYTRAASPREAAVLKTQEAAHEAVRARLQLLGRARLAGRGQAAAHLHPSAHRHRS